MTPKLFYLVALAPLFAIAQNKNQPKWKSPAKNDLAFKVSIPEGNFFYLNKGDSYGNAFGFLGLSIGCEYYFSDKYNINVDVGTLTDFIVPFPAPYDVEGSYDRSFAFYGDVQVGTNFNRFHIDAGIQYYKTSYYERETVSLFPDYIDTLKYAKHQGNLGLAFSSYFRITRSFNVGINYYPAIVVFDDHATKTHYGHLLFLELIFRINRK